MKSVVRHYNIKNERILTLTTPHVNAVSLERSALGALDVRRDPLRAPIGMIGPTRLLTPMTAHPPSVAVLTVTR